jgi:hypothetical protein
MSKVNLSNYEEVKDRIKRFYESFTDGRIITEMVRLAEDSKTVFFRAVIFKNSREQAENLPLASGFAFEREGSNTVNRTSHVENCETSAIGRALANMNFIKGQSRPSREEMLKVLEGEKSSIKPEAGELKELRQLFKDSKFQAKHDLFDELIREHGKDLLSWPREVIKEFEFKLKEVQDAA